MIRSNPSIFGICVGIKTSFFNAFTVLTRYEEIFMYAKVFNVSSSIAITSCWNIYQKSDLNIAASTRTCEKCLTYQRSMKWRRKWLIRFNIDYNDGHLNRFSLKKRRFIDAVLHLSTNIKNLSRFINVSTCRFSIRIVNTVWIIWIVFTALT